MTRDSKTDEVSDLDIQALVDGQILPAKQTALMNEIMKSPYALKRLEELLRQKSILREWWKKTDPR